MTAFHIIRKRLLSLVFVVIGVSIITFIVSNLIPGDPARLVAGERATDEIVQAMRAKLGLDLPLYEQYWRYFKGLLQGDLGTSIRTGRPVLHDLLVFFPATLELALVALVFSVLIGVPLGVLSAVYKDSWIDHICRWLSVSGISMPAFWLGLGLIVIFYSQLGLFPAGGRLSQGLSPPEHISGFYMLDALLQGQWQLFFNAAQHMVLPAITLGFVHLGVVSRQIRSAMLEQLNEDYLRTVKAYGLPRGRVIFRYALPNALLPSITVIGLSLGDLLYGAVLTETVFAWPGMGLYVVDSIQALDFPAVMGFAILVSFIYVLLNLCVDLLYRFVDPRIKEVG
ncbi:MAG TPA: ABC transporter permease [Paenalcaligenes sp.]|nr:ABC transporter permease [Paenalcaligenes sp.]